MSERERRSPSSCYVPTLPLAVDSRRKSRSTLEGLHPGATFLDATSRGLEPWLRFSPFFPHGGIPVPFTPGRTSQSVEGIWQGLKVFERAGVDPSRFDVRTMSGLKRTMRTFGPVLGHQKGLEQSELLSYLDARRSIYLPSYLHQLKVCVPDLVAELLYMSQRGNVVLLDYETNCEIADLSRPLSHAALVVEHVNATP